MNRSIALLALLCTTGAAFADFSFGRARNYPHLGIMMPTLERARPDPPPSPRAQAYVLIGDPCFDFEDRFDPEELWDNHQRRGRWRTACGITLTIGRITHVPPGDDDPLISRAAFHDGLATDANRIDPRVADALDEWVERFTGLELSAPESLRLNAFSLDVLLRYPTEEPNTLVYVFQPRRLGDSPPHNWFCVALSAPNAANPDTLRAHFEETFISRISLPSRMDRDQGAQAGVLPLPRPEQTLPDLPDHPIRIEARASVENYPEWWVAETDGYIILSDVATEVGQSVIRDLQETLPLLRAAFARLLPPIVTTRDVAVLRLFQSRDDYVRYVGEAYAWSSAIWMPARRELALFQQGSKDDMMRTIRHEAFHQYLSSAYGRVPAAPWLNEGHACLFENIRIDDRGRITIQEDPARVAMLLERLDIVVAFLPDLLQASHETFYEGTDEERRLKYAMAWGLVYYLQKGAPLERNTPFKDILPRYAASLAATRDGATATLLAFADHDLAVFQQNFREFWLKRRGSALRYDPLAP